MEFNMDDAGATFEKGKRYPLVVSGAREGTGKTNATPFLEIKFQTETGEDAHSVTLYNTPKAMFRAVPWFKALQLDTKGNVSVYPDRLPGIRLSAVAGKETYTDANGDSHEKTTWTNPEPFIVGEAAPVTPAPSKPAAETAQGDVPAAATPVSQPAPAPETYDDVPF